MLSSPLCMFTPIYWLCVKCQNYADLVDICNFISTQFIRLPFCSLSDPSLITTTNDDLYYDFD